MNGASKLKTATLDRAAAVLYRYRPHVGHFSFIEVFFVIAEAIALVMSLNLVSNSLLSFVLSMKPTSRRIAGAFVFFRT